MPGSAARDRGAGADEAAQCARGQPGGEDEEVARHSNFRDLWGLKSAHADRGVICRPGKGSPTRREAR
jgi:hypothetical protein